MAQNFINGILIPEDGEPRRVALETDGRGLMGDALSRLVGGCFDTLPIVIPGVDLWVNDDGTSEFGPNRAIYATRAMEERGYLSQIDYRHVPAEGELYTILHGPIVALGFDPDSGASVSLTEEQAETVTEYFTETSPPEADCWRTFVFVSACHRSPPTRRTRPTRPASPRRPTWSRHP
ncbi:DUF3846 domain-containing protein [Bifidobacterium adolescentis]|uniref:DUF3846 domain-containing protein n=1 Tax=Bifidobacterium adolescentis TaxID=1680 RepID=UPI000E4B5ABE|nr:DUF3846 domain-containing protein [Bifidobacterium adolescentis]RGV14454.1 DUF3846 domain-containing protein [Bifidobacterium adolescentis]